MAGNLLDQLTRGTGLALGTQSFILCLVASVVAALLIEALYLLFYEQRATGSQLHRSFILLGPSITFLFICVQLSLPLSLGLLGALSIVRFRTPIKEPEEIGFLMLLIAAAIGIATFNFVFVVLLYVAVALLLGVRRWVQLRKQWQGRRGGMLLANLAEEVYEQKGDELTARLSDYFTGLRLESIASVEGTTSLQYVFAGMSRTPWPEFQKQLHDAVPCNKINVFFNRPVPV